MKDKQIDEFRYLADEMGKAISTEYERRVLADERKLEEVLKKNGWRKASEVIDDFVEALKEEKRIALDSIGLPVGMVLVDDIDYCADELKKKYTEDGK